MKRCMLLLMVVLAFGTTAMADLVGVSYLSSSLNVIQWSAPSPLIPMVSPGLIIIPGAILVPTVSPHLVLLHSVSLDPTPSPFLGAGLLSIGGHSANLGVLPPLGSTGTSATGGSVILIGTQLVQISYP